MDKKEWCKKIDDAYNLIKKPLIMSFTEFYGEEYLDKITDVINNLVIMKMCPNYSKEDFESEKKKVLYELNGLVKKIASSMNLQAHDINSMMIVTRLENCSKEELEKLLSVYPKLDKGIMDDAIKLKMRYDYLDMSLNEKVNDVDSSIFLGINDEELTDTDKSKLNRQVQRGNKNSVLDAYHFMYMPVIGVKQPVINMHSIIHEINHLLREKVELNLPINDNLDIRDKWYGVNNYNPNKDLFYEIVNDLMAKDIFEIFVKYYKDNSRIVENEMCNSYYLFIDSVTKGIVSGIYNNNKEVIKSVLIEVGGDKFVDVINLENYSMINEMLVKVYENTSKMFKNRVSIRKIYEDGINKQDLEVLNSVSQIISRKLSNYQQDECQYPEHMSK